MGLWRLSKYEVKNENVIDGIDSFVGVHTRPPALKIHGELQLQSQCNFTPSSLPFPLHITCTETEEGLGNSIFPVQSQLFLCFVPCSCRHVWRVCCVVLVVLVCAFDCNHMVHIHMGHYQRPKPYYSVYLFILLLGAFLLRCFWVDCFHKAFQFWFWSKSKNCWNWNVSVALHVACCNGISAKGNKVKLQHEHAAAASVVLKSSPWLFLLLLFLCVGRDISPSYSSSQTPPPLLTGACQHHHRPLSLSFFLII